jgi:hypothetical protein
LSDVAARVLRDYYAHVDRLLAGHIAWVVMQDPGSPVLALEHMRVQFSSLYDPEFTLDLEKYTVTVGPRVAPAARTR